MRPTYINQLVVDLLADFFIITDTIHYKKDLSDIGLIQMAHNFKPNIKPNSKYSCRDGRIYLST